jgi:hypothetical protein
MDKFKNIGRKKQKEGKTHKNTTQKTKKMSNTAQLFK